MSEATTERMRISRLRLFARRVIPIHFAAAVRLYDIDECESARTHRGFSLSDLPGKRGIRRTGLIDSLSVARQPTSAWESAEKRDGQHSQEGLNSNAQGKTGEWEIGLWPLPSLWSSR